MTTCASCGNEISGSSRFCPDCGSNVNLAGTDSAKPRNASRIASDDATIDVATVPSSRPLRTPSAPSRPSISGEYSVSEGRFLPGRLLAGRYRIISLLGRGGMGEVYRADDLTLGQSVALKFLPDDATGDEGLLERFRNEVRIARRVSHPNVCRVYDVGEVDGQNFFTMEYIDGEDLATLLRRIGRLPHDKALDIARQMCAGLAAAHTKGVLHRDLKPANIMLDGRGQVVITDFGLAGIAGHIQGSEIRSGTPAYMSPEQLAGKEVSTRSDIYALGLVLYEVFTGKRAFTEPVAERLRSGGNPTISRPSTVVKDMDPVVERVILRCVEAEPSARPANVLSVAAALPGGDPLAAALAAGETPSPELVAASGETSGLRPRTAVACLAAILLGLAATYYFTVRYSALEKMHLEQPPEVLTQKAREIVARLGYPEKPADSASGFDENADFSNYVEKDKNNTPHWDEVLAGRPTLLQYWYRQSPKYMTAGGYRDLLFTRGVITEYDPAAVVSGMINVELDPKGRLINFQAVPPQKDVTSPATGKPDWGLLFAAADVDPATLQTATPQWNSLGSADARAAWTGTWPGTHWPLRVEAAAWHGKPVYFALIGDWTKPERMVAEDSSADVRVKIGQTIALLMLLALLVSAFVLARRNYRAGRADQDGALRLAGVMFVLDILLWLCRSHFVPGWQTFFTMLLSIASGLLVSGIVWMLYLALEPWIRRRWPHAIISWSRVLSGQLRDPVVGRDILFGVAFGVVWTVLFAVAGVFLARAGAAPQLTGLGYLPGGRQALGQWLIQAPSSIFSTLEFFFLMLGLKVLLRKDWIAATAFVALFVVIRGLQSSHPMVDLPLTAIVFGLLVLIVFRFGLVPLAVGAFTTDMLTNVPFTADFSSWYMADTLLALLSVVALAGWGFYHSLGSGHVWAGEDE